MNLIFLSVALLFSGQSPTCLSNTGQQLQVDNAQVLNWKASSKNNFHSRARVLGVVGKVYADKTKHDHFQIKIGDQPQDTIEIIYNSKFGPLPDLQAGMTIEACGDYITSNKQSGNYPSSPDGAIIHWVHRSPNPHHPSGYLITNGVLCGYN